MTDLTERQKQLLKAIIELYVKTGEPISSDIIEKKCDMGVSPATIRNEMSRLADAGFLKQPHTSSGRIPTSLGFRLYIAELMHEKDMPVVDEVTIRQQVLDQRTHFNRMVQVATRALAQKLGTLALVYSNGEIYYTGAANILDIPEFYDIDVTRFVLSLFDETSLLQQIISKGQGDDALHIIFGDETDFAALKTTSFAFLDFEVAPGRNGVIGVIGPDRLNFPVVIPYLRYVGHLLEETMKAR